MPPIDPKDMRAGDSDREAVAEILRQATGDGRLDLDELDERLDRAYAAKTYAELDAVIADLPGGHQRRRHPTVPATDAAGTVTIAPGMSNENRSGQWVVPQRLVVRPAIADVKLDFRQADCAHSVVDIDVKGGTGNVILIVPAGWAVDTTELRTSWGSIKNPRQGVPDPDKTLIRVFGGIGMGTLKVRDPYFYEK